MKKSLVQLADGTIQEVELLSKKDAAEIVRVPQVKAAINNLTKNNAEMSNWLFDNRPAILTTYNAGSVRRVTKSERKALEKSLEHVVETLKNDIKAKFVVENSAAIFETFKWPNQKRVAPEEKEAFVKEAFYELTDGNEGLTEWLLENKSALLEAYDTGLVKREVSPEMLAKLAEARAKRSAK
jgi:hypothetical protein